MPVTPAYIAKPLTTITDAEKAGFIQSLRDDLAKARALAPVPGPKPGYVTKAIDQMNESEKLDAIQSLRADLAKTAPAATPDLSFGGSSAGQHYAPGQPGYPNQPGDPNQQGLPSMVPAQSGGAMGHPDTLGKYASVPAFGPASPMPPISVIQHMSSNNHAMAVLDSGWENGTLVIHVS